MIFSPKCFDTENIFKIKMNRNVEVEKTTLVNPVMKSGFEREEKEVVI